MENIDLNNITPKERTILQEVIRKMRNAVSRNLTNSEKESTFINKLKAERASNNIPMINRLLGVYNTYQEETTKFLCGYESNHLLMHSALKDTIISNATEIVEHMLKHPFCYDQEIYSKILTDHVE